MYQYNFYRYLTEKYPTTEVFADLTWFYSNNDHHGYELFRNFNLDQDSDHKLKVASKSQIFKVTGQIPPLVKGKLAKKVVFLLGPVNRILREHFTTAKLGNHIDQLDGDISNKTEILENGEESCPFYDKVNNLDVSKDWYFTGFFIEERYHRNRIEKLKKELLFPEITDEDNLRILKDIRDNNSVSIHVRRGDYLSSTYASMFKSLGREYYEAAVRIIRERVDNPKFYLFSDDPEYMKEAFDWLEPKEIVNINSGDNSFRDMQLMSNCKHNIVANSTFSQWGALLNDNAGHMTIYPSAYLADEDTEVKTIPGWIRV